ncbi:hypothetical protein F01_260344 [Burkholderia cenocepacia]|nr:hypothetical protein F01_260344 [Burkholderia cenocepacia]
MARRPVPGRRNDETKLGLIFLNFFC